MLHSQIDESFESNILHSIMTDDVTSFTTTLNAEKQKLQLDAIDANKIILKKLNAIRTSTGSPLLHVATLNGMKNILSALLTTGLDVNALDQQGRTALKVAEQYLKNGDLRHEMITLLKIKENVDMILAGFNIQRAGQLMDLAASAANIAKGQEKVLIIGPTGAGKSTLLNYLNGTQYEIVRKVANWHSQPVKGTHKEVAKTETTFGKSQTLLPQVIKNQSQGFVYCDLAGLFDSRGKEEQLCAAFSATLLSQSPGDIKGIIVVLDAQGFQLVKGEAFKDTALTLWRLINNNPQLMDNVTFVISKVHPEKIGTLTIEEILINFIHPLLDVCEASGDKALYNMLNAMKIRSQNIIVPDIRDQGQSCKRIEAMLQRQVALKANLFNFSSFDNTQKEFNEVLSTIMVGFLSRIHKIKNEIPAIIEQNSLSQQSLVAKIHRAEFEIEALKTECDLQLKLDQIVENWVRVESIKTGTDNNKESIINQLLNESIDLLDELTLCDPKDIAQKIGWLSIISSSNGVERKALLKTELQLRRWQLPWPAQGGPASLLGDTIKLLQDFIATTQQELQGLSNLHAKYQQLIRDFELEMEIIKEIYNVTYKLIMVLDYHDENSLAFKKAFEAFFGLPSNEKKTSSSSPRFNFAGSQNPSSSIPTETLNKDAQSPSMRQHYKK